MVIQDLQGVAKILVRILESLDFLDESAEDHPKGGLHFAYGFLSLHCDEPGHLSLGVN